MSEAFTKGPWETFNHSFGCGVMQTNGWDIAHCHGFDDKRSKEEEFANARLMAAAPDLLEALEALLLQSVKGHSIATRLEFSEAGRDILKQCKTAIAKARGQQ